MTEEFGARELYMTFQSKVDQPYAWEHVDEFTREAWRAIARKVGWCSTPEARALQHELLAACEVWAPKWSESGAWRVKVAITRWLRAKP